MDARLPAHLEASGLIRAVEAAGGFAAVVQRGERDAGVILLITRDRDEDVRLWERMPHLGGPRPFTVTRYEIPGKKQEFSEYIERRRQSDPDCWVIELDIAHAERFIDSAMQ